MFETSEKTEKLDAALAKAQGEIDNAFKEGENNHFQSNYVTLGSARHSARNALAKYGISVTQWLLPSDNNKLNILTRVACDGQWMKSTFSMPVTRQDAHGYASAVTYCRRFSFMAALGLAPEDDDGNHASDVSHGHKHVNTPHNHSSPEKHVPQQTAAHNTPTNPRPSGASKPANSESKPPRLNLTQQADLLKTVEKYGWKHSSFIRYLNKHNVNKVSDLCVDDINLILLDLQKSYIKSEFEEAMQESELPF